MSRKARHAVFDLATRELLWSRPNPLETVQVSDTTLAIELPDGAGPEPNH
jgi:hypothetical protein